MYAKKLCNILIELGILALIIFPPIVFGAVQPQHITAIQGIIFGIWLIWIIKSFTKGVLTYVLTSLDLPMFLFLGLGLVNLLTSTCMHNTEKSLYLMLNYGLLYFLLVQQLKTVRRILGLAFIIVLIGSGESLFGLFQYLRGAKTVLGVMTPNIGTVNATYMSHNHFAGFLILIIPIALGLLVGASHFEKRFFIFLLIGLLGATLILTLSRGGILSFLLALGCFFLCLFLKRQSSAQKIISFRSLGIIIVLLVIFISIVIGWIGISPIAHRSLFETFFLTDEALKQEIRLPLWRNALVLVKESPIFGSGLGTFEYVFLRYRPDNIPQDKQAYHAHNDYLELLIEMGFSGLIIVIWAIFRFSRYVLRGYFHHNDPVLTPLMLGGFTGCTAMLIHSFFDFNLQIPANALLFFIVLAMTTATLQLMGLKHEGLLKRYRFKTSWQFAIVVLCMTGILAYNFRKNIAMTYYREAKKAHYQGELFLPITLYQKAIAIDRQNPLFYEALGTFYRVLGENRPHAEKWYTLAVAQYKKAIALNAYNPVYYYYLGWAYDALGMEEEAVQAFRDAIDRNPRISRYYENLGSYFLSIEQMKAAMHVYRQAIQIDPQRMPMILEMCRDYKLSYAEYRQLIPEDAENRKMFAQLLVRQGNWEASKIEYRTAIELSGKHTQYYNTMLEACRQQHDYECMRTLWRELWQQEPDNLNFPINIAESFAQQQLWDQAVEHYQTMLIDHPDNVQIHQRLAQLYQQQGRYDEAIEEYTQILDTHPDDVNTYHHIAGIYRQNTQWKAAIDIYRKALENGLIQAVVYSNIGELYLQIGEQQNAFEMYKQAIQAGETRIAVYQELERLYWNQKNTIDAEVLWDTYAIANKHDPEALFQLVMHYNNEGEWLKAVTLSKEVIASAPTNANYRKFLANLYEQKGMLFETIQQWEKLVNMHSENIEYYLYLAMLYEQTEQPDKARMQYQKILRIQPNNQQAQQKLSSLGG